MTFERLLAYFRLGENAEDPSAALASIERNVIFRGTNLLILIFAILIASVGLNVNSAAVIIGAMLISPLMGPIVGVGAGLGVMDLALVRRSLNNVGFAVLASLATSTLYFLISPLTDSYSEILARTSPSIWDVLIALCGGFAGIIATTSKDRGNVVPGVAIATALMPPLCTAGYGLANLNWPFFFGALYLFIINSVFISLAALFTVRWLGYPMKRMENDRIARQVKRVTGMIVLLTVIPSVYLAYRLVVQNGFEHAAARYIEYDSVVPNNYLADHSVDAKRRTVSLTYVGNGIDTLQRIMLRQRLAARGLQEARLEIRTGLSLQELNKTRSSVAEAANNHLQEQQVIMMRLAALKDSLATDERFKADLMAEAKAEHPGLRWLVIADLPSDSASRIVSTHFTQSPDTAEVRRLERWLDVKLSNVRHTLSISTEPTSTPKVDRRRRSK